MLVRVRPSVSRTQKARRKAGLLVTQLVTACPPRILAASGCTSEHSPRRPNWCLTPEITDIWRTGDSVSDTFSARRGVRSSGTGWGALALAALRLRVERLLGDARPVLTCLLENPLALLRRQSPPDVEQRQGDSDGAETTRERKARHATYLARSRYFLLRLAASAAIVFAVDDGGLTT